MLDELPVSRQPECPDCAPHQWHILRCGHRPSDTDPADPNAGCPCTTSSPSPGAQR